MPARQALKAAFAMAALLLAAPAGAQVSCSLQVPAMSFGRLDILGALPVDRTLGTIEITCSNAGASTVVVPIRTSVSQGGSGDENRRRMAGPGGAAIEYNLFRDVSRTQLWRVSGNPPADMTVPANNQARLLLTVFGRVYGPRDAREGAYQDTLIATLEF